MEKGDNFNEIHSKEEQIFENKPKMKPIETTTSFGMVRVYSGSNTPIQAEDEKVLRCFLNIVGTKVPLINRLRTD